MSMKRHLFSMAGLVAVCAIGVGVLAHAGGLPLSRADLATVRSVRAGILAEIDRLQSASPSEPSREDGHWKAYLQLVDSELAHGHIDAAVRVWHDAYCAALESRSWESMIAVGDAFLRIGEAAGTPRGARMNARQAYLSGLIRARRSHSVDGMFRSADAFQALGDQAIAEQCLLMAAQLVDGEALAQGRVDRALGAGAGLRVAPEF